MKTELKHRQGRPFSGHYHWESERDEFEPAQGGELEGYLEQQYERTGKTCVECNGERYQRIPFA